MSYAPLPTRDEDMDIADLAAHPHADLPASPTLRNANSASVTDGSGSPLAMSSTKAPAAGARLTISTTAKQSTAPEIRVAASPTGIGPTTTPRRFIRIVGVPSAANDPSLVDTVVIHSANITSPAPAVPALSPTSAAKYLVDVIDAENEDPFTLEPFEALLRLCADQGKDFILARVTTADPNDETKFYYSYYAAHHINKVLFRTQPEEGLLHRMKAKNPLNNMTIVGDVSYYRISPSQAHQGSPAGSSPASAASGKSGKSTSSARHSILFDKLPTTPRGTTLADKIRRAFFPATSPPTSPTAAAGNDHASRKLHLVMTQPLLEGTARRPSADDIFQYIAKSSPTDAAAPAIDLARLCPPPQPTSPATSARLGAPTGEEVKGRRLRHQRSMSTSAVHLADLVAGNADAARGPASSSVAAPPPATHRIKVRSLSYRNDVAAAGMTQPLSVDRWLAAHCGESVAQLVLEDTNGTTTGSATATAAPGAQRRRAPRSASAKGSPTAPAPIVYEAKFFATDDDFLMKSSVRAFFKQHAVEADDAVLFEIPSSTTVMLPHDHQGLDPHPALDGFHYTVDRGEPMSVVAAVRAFLRGSHLLKLILVGYVVVGIVLLKFVVPENLVFLCSFILVFVLCFFLVFFVEIDI
ncbi:hypothetical protein GGF31_001802 [Allomyces arbusculus]|nr:hypothetical protein GGF31_001802 [Allomyces arbusculus]